MTDDQLRDLRNQSRNDGDYATAWACTFALSGDQSWRDWCEEIISTRCELCENESAVGKYGDEDHPPRCLMCQGE